MGRSAPYFVALAAGVLHANSIADWWAGQPRWWLQLAALAALAALLQGAGGVRRGADRLRPREAGAGAEFARGDDVQPAAQPVGVARGDGVAGGGIDHDSSALGAERVDGGVEIRRFVPARLQR